MCGEEAFGWADGESYYAVGEGGVAIWWNWGLMISGCFYFY